MLPLDRIPHIAQYTGPWAIEERAFREGLAHVRTPDLLEAHLAAVKPRSERASIGDYAITVGGVAVIDLVGTMTKYGSSLSQLLFGTVGVRQAIRLARASDDVRSILLLVDSPGGTVAGTEELADDLAAVNKEKPVTAYIEDLGASAAYWVSSAAGRVVANAGALVGSIGTYMVVDDLSAFYAAKGVRTHVIKAGKFKGSGIEGAPITHEELEEYQRLVDGINERFLQGVARGRRMAVEDVREIADGRVHLAADAFDLGLIDGVETFEATVATLEKKYGARRPAGKAMSDGEKPQAATLEEIKLFCPGADDSWILKQLGAKATVDQARSSWAEEQQRRLAEKDKALAEAQAKARESERKRPGVQPLGDGTAAAHDGTEGAEDPATEWRKEIEAKVRLGIPRGRAACMVARERPELREAVVEAANRGRKTA